MQGERIKPCKSRVRGGGKMKGARKEGGEGEGGEGEGGKEVARRHALVLVRALASDNESERAQSSERNKLCKYRVRREERERREG